MPDATMTLVKLIWLINLPASVSGNLQIFTFSVIFIRNREFRNGIGVSGCDNRPMPETQNAADRMLGLLVVVATIVTIGFNALAALGLVNGVTPATISERHPSVITPAGYAFSIWSLIYLWLVAFAIYQILRPERAGRRNIRLLYLASCVLNCAWIWFWHRSFVGVCLVLIVLLAVVLSLIVKEFSERATFREALFTKAPFGLYFGWVICAALINLNIVLTPVISGENVLNLLGAISIVIATAAAVLVCWKLHNYLFPLAAAWALAAIAINQTGHTSIIITAAFGTIVCLLTAGTIVTKLKDSTSE